MPAAPQPTPEHVAGAAAERVPRQSGAPEPSSGKRPALRPAARRALTDRRLLPAAIGVAAGFAAYLLVRDSLIDDTYITLCYARNLAFHGQWAMVTGHPANTATSPLNVLILAAAAFVTRHVVLGLGLVFAGTCGALAAALDGLFARCGLNRRGAVAATLLVIANPLLLSTVGMEIMLVLLIAVLTLRAALAGRPVACGLLTAAMLLARIDALVISAVLILGVPAARRSWPRIAGVAALAAAPWFLFSWTVLGAALPDSVIIKMIHGGWNGDTFANGLYVYFEHMPTAITVALAAALAGLLWTVPAIRHASAEAAWRRPVALFAIAAVTHFAVLAATRPAPYHWYYGPSIGLATIAFAALCSRPATARVPRTLAIAALVPALTVAVAFDVTWGMPWSIAPVSTNWARSAEYTAIGRQLGPELHGGAVRSPGEVGELAYFCNCDIVDEFTSRSVFLHELKTWDNSGGTLRRAFIGLDYLFSPGPGAQPQTPYTLVPVRVPQKGAVAHWPIGTPWTRAELSYAHDLELQR